MNLCLSRMYLIGTSGKSLNTTSPNIKSGEWAIISGVMYVVIQKQKNQKNVGGYLKTKTRGYFSVITAIDQ